MGRLKLKLLAILLSMLITAVILPAKAYALTTPAVPTGLMVSAANSTQILQDRIAGSDRYETSAAIAKRGWNTSYYAILASGENFPDALTAAPLAMKYNAPLLLTSRDRLETSTQNELLTLKVKKVIIIGGTGVISGTVEQTLMDLGMEVERIAGQDRYETSLKVANLLGQADEAVIATGEDFPDVLSIAPIAALKGMPILLTPKDELSKNLKSLLAGMVKKTYVLGNADVISDHVMNQLPSPQRLSGANRYAANIQIIKAFAGDLKFSTSYLATGESFPDALSGVALATLTSSPVILVSDPLDQATRSFVQDSASAIQKVIALGGTGVVSESLLNEIAPTAGSGHGNSNGDGNSNSTLAAPANVSATALSSSQIYLYWDPVSYDSYYQVYRSTSSTGPYTNIATMTTHYYSDTYLSPGTTYFYKVQAVSSLGASPYSNIVYATTLSGNSALASPTNLKATPLANSQIFLTWNTVLGASSYNVYRATSDSTAYTLLTSVSSPYYADTNVISGTTYYYKVQAVNSLGPGAESSIVYASLSGNGTLSSPTNVVATTLSTSQIYLAWDTVTNATYYNIYRSTLYSGPYTLITTTTTPYYADNSLAPGTTYYYKVQAVNSQYTGAYSNIVYATTLSSNTIGTLLAPSNVKASSLSSSQIFLTWDVVSNAVYYNVYRAFSASGTYTLVATVTNPYYLDSGLSSGTAYYYRVQAGNTAGTSSYSSLAYATTS